MAVYVCMHAHECMHGCMFVCACTHLFELIDNNTTIIRIVFCDVHMLSFTCMIPLNR